MEPLVNGPGLMSTHGGPKSRTTAVVSEFSFDSIKVNDLAQQPGRSARVLFPRFVELPSAMRLMWSST